MSYFVSLVQNEWMKTNSKRQLPYFLIFVVVLSIFLAVIMYSFASPATSEVSNEICFLLIQLTSIFIMIVSAQIITDEYKDGTIKQILIRPASRTMVLMSKFVTIIFVLLVAYVCIILVTALLFGSMFTHFKPNEDLQLIGNIVNQTLFSFPEMLFYALVAFTLAIVTHSIGLSLAITFVLKWFVRNLVLTFFWNKAWCKYLIFANLDWKQYFAGILPPYATSLGYSIVIYALYMISLFIISIMVFKKRDIQ